MITILLPNSGLPGTQGALYMLRKELQVRVIGVDANPQILQRRFVDLFYEVPATHSPQYLEVIEAIIAQEKVDVVLPQSDPEALFFAQHIKIPVAASPPEAIRAAFDKSALLALFEELKLPTPRHRIVESEKELCLAALELGYPEKELVIKPLTLWGGRGVHLLSAFPLSLEHFLSQRQGPSRLTLEQMRGVMERASVIPKFLLMEHLPGKEYSVDAFLGQKGGVAVARVREQVSGGTAFLTRMEQQEEVTAWTLLAARTLGLRSAFGMQFKCDALGVPNILECNPRLQGTAVASSFSGVNFAALAVQEALGLSPTPPTPSPHSVTFSRHWGGVAFGEGWEERVD